MRLLLATLAGLLMASAAFAQTYNYTARTQTSVLRSGNVVAGSLTWQCSGQACTISGPWPTPGEGACAQLAQEVGRITEYGHPGRRLDTAALDRCNRNVTASSRSSTGMQLPQARGLPLPQVTPPERDDEPRYSVVTGMRATIAAPTHETITVEAALTERIYAIRDGGGDGDFGGNGPRVNAQTTISVDGSCVLAEIEMTAVETQSDWTAGRATARRHIWCDPAGRPITRIEGILYSTAGYVDHDWEIDTVVPGYGEVDARRTLPEVAGPVASFIIMGDTTGDIFSNDDDGRDVGDLDGDGLRTVSRTSVQVQFNPIRVVLPVPAPVASSPPGTETVWLKGQHSAFYVLRHTGGDAEFFGHGPRMVVTSRLDLSSGADRIVATITGSAVETEGGDTRAASSHTETIWTAPPGWRIDTVEVQFGWEGPGRIWMEADETALGRIARSSFIDTDYEHDFLVEGAREARRSSDNSIYFDGTVDTARREARSHVDAFRVIGDTNGEEAGSRTGVQAFYWPLRVTLSPTNPARARVADLAPDVFLDVPTGDSINRLSGGNSCGPQAGSRVLRFYGVRTTYEQFKRRVQSSTNFVSDQSLGTPSGTLRDRMNDLAPGFVHQVLPLGTSALRRNALDRIRNLLDQGKPVMTLISWGSQFAADIYSPHDAAATSHWVVVRGYNARNRTFLIVDNGHAVEWSYTLFESLFDYGQDLQYEIALAVVNVEKGSIIYRR